MLSRLTGRGEGPRTAILPEVDDDLLAETLTAFANSDGGTLLVGLDATGQPTGRVSPDEMEGALRVAETHCHPPVHASWEHSETPGGSVIAIRVPRSPDLHSLVDGRVLVRQGKDNRPLGGKEIRQLASSKESGSFEEQESAGASQSKDWDSKVLDEYLQQRQERGAARTTDLQQLLFEVGAITAGRERSCPRAALSLSSSPGPSRALRTDQPAMAAAKRLTGRSPALWSVPGTWYGKR